MIRRPPRSTRTDTLFPDTTLFRAVVRRALGFRVATDRQNLAQLGRRDPGIRKRQVACAAKPEFGALAVLRIHENPAPPAMLVDEQIKAAAIRMQIGRASCRERVCQYV